MINAYIKIWEEMLIYNNNEMDSRRFSTYLFLGSLLPGLVVSAVVFAELLLTFSGMVIGSAMIHAIAYTYLLLGANSRAKQVEEVLPDFLSLVSSNIRSGLTPDKALIVSARDEFGPLTDAIVKAGKKSITGMPLDEVMLGMTEHIKSSVFKKTIVMVVEGLHSGGDMAELLEKTALDVRKFRSVRKEVNSIILNYVLFIIAAITFGAPLLYGVSTFLVEIMVLIKSKIGTGTEAASALAGQVGVFKGQLMLTPEAVTMFAALAIGITVLFGCMAVGIMSSGKRVDGLKYFPGLLLISLGILFGVKAGLGAVLGGLIV